MPNTSKKKTAGPSLGSGFSFLLELIKRLSPVFSDRTTEELDRLKQKHAATIGRAITRLLNGQGIVPTCGVTESARLEYEVDEPSSPEHLPHFHKEIVFEIKTFTRQCVDEKGMIAIDEVVINVLIPGKVHVAEFTIMDCDIVLKDEDMLISLTDFRKWVELNWHNDEYLHCMVATFLAQHYILLVVPFPSQFQFELIHKHSKQQRGHSPYIARAAFEKRT